MMRLRTECGRSAVSATLHMAALVAVMAGVLAGNDLSSVSIATPALAADAPASARIAASVAIKAHMTAIRDDVANVHSLVTHRRLPKQMAVNFAEKVARSVAAIRNEVAPNAPLRNAIEPLLVQISAGAEAVAGRDAVVGPIDGIVAIDEALAAYPKLFDHPGWKGAREL